MPVWWMNRQTKTEGSEGVWNLSGWGPAGMSRGGPAPFSLPGITSGPGKPVPSSLAWLAAPQALPALRGMTTGSA